MMSDLEMAKALISNGTDAALARMWIAYIRGVGIRMSREELRQVIGPDQSLRDRLHSAYISVIDKEGEQ